jgi:hypothetical protein
MPISIAIALATVAGTASAHTEAPRSLEGRTRAAGPITYVYINAATGERLFTAEPGRPASAGRQSSEEVWIADNQRPCAAYGSDYGWVGLVDEPGNGTPAEIGATFLDWGDVAFDTVVDCVQVTWASAHTDSDSDGDGFADGVEGFGSSWTWYDTDNGFNNNLTRSPLISFTLQNLPGNLTADLNEFETYVATVDLVGGFDAPRSFEICDTDGDPQGAAVHNPFIGIGDIDFDGQPDGDLDGDGLADFAYTQRFYQPGSTDFDGDGVPDGDPAAAQTAILLVAPSGPTVLTDDGWTIDPVAPPPAGQGVEDAFDILTDINNDGFFEPYGTFFYGGFSCDRDGNGVPGDAPDDYRSFAQFYHALYGPQGVDPQPCPADFFPPGGDGVVNFFDVSAFIAAYGDGLPSTDVFPPGGDGELNFFDLAEFIRLFGEGCP